MKGETMTLTSIIKHTFRPVKVQKKGGDASMMRGYFDTDRLHFIMTTQIAFVARDIQSALSIELEVLAHLKKKFSCQEIRLAITNHKKEVIFYGSVGCEDFLNSAEEENGMGYLPLSRYEALPGSASPGAVEKEIGLYLSSQKKKMKKSASSDSEDESSV